MKAKTAKIIYIVVFLVLIITGICLYASEEFDRIPSLEGDGNYLFHADPLVPRESPDLLIAEDGKLFLFYIDTELVNVYTVSGDYLYGIQFPDGQNGRSNMFYKDGLLYVDARGSGIYVFQDTQLLRFELQHIDNDGHDELEEVFSDEEDHIDGEYTYFYTEDTNKITRQHSAGSETVLHFPEKKIDVSNFLLLICLMICVKEFTWGKMKQDIRNMY